MTYRAPIPVGPENEDWPEDYSAKEAFTEAVTALTDSSLALESAVDAIESADIQVMLSSFQEQRQAAKRKLIDLGVSDGYRIDDVDPSTAEAIRRTWMSLKAKVVDDGSVLETLANGERETIERLERAMGRGMSPALENVLGTANEQIRDNLDLLRAK